MFKKNSNRDFRAFLADRSRILPHDRNLFALFSAVQKFEGSSPPSRKKNLPPKHTKFGAISDEFNFDRKYLQNESI